jgi:hypothetical protein
LRETTTTCSHGYRAGNKNKATPNARSIGNAGKTKKHATATKGPQETQEAIPEHSPDSPAAGENGLPPAKHFLSLSGWNGRFAIEIFACAGWDSPPEWEPAPAGGAWVEQAECTPAMQPIQVIGWYAWYGSLGANQSHLVPGKQITA